MPRTLASCGVLAIILLAASASAQSNVTVRFLTASGDPVGNVTANFYQNGVFVAQNFSDAQGYVKQLNLTGAVNVTATYPSSAYSAVLENLTISSPVHIDNGYLTISARLRNTLGQSLEGQDCAVYVKDGGGFVVHRYDTTCRQGEVFIDGQGNYQAVTNCPLTDSHGIYTFKGAVTGEDGFVRGGNYTAVLHCNDKELTGAFTVTHPRQPDVGGRLESARLNSGVLVGAFLLVMALFVALLVLLVAVRAAWKNR